MSSEVKDYFSNGIQVKDTEPVEVAIKRFKREVTKWTLVHKTSYFFPATHIQKQKAEPFYMILSFLSTGDAGIM